MIIGLLELDINGLQIGGGGGGGGSQCIGKLLFNYRTSSLSPNTYTFVSWRDIYSLHQPFFVFKPPPQKKICINILREDPPFVSQIR